jgi:hypothetical protein
LITAFFVATLPFFQASIGVPYIRAVLRASLLEQFGGGKYGV